LKKRKKRKGKGKKKRNGEKSPVLGKPFATPYLLYERAAMGKKKKKRRETRGNSGVDCLSNAFVAPRKRHGGGEERKKKKEEGEEKVPRAKTFCVRFRERERGKRKKKKGEKKKLDPAKEGVKPISAPLQ